MSCVQLYQLIRRTLARLWISPSRRPRWRRITVESLEPRTMLSAAMVADLHVEPVQCRHSPVPRISFELVGPWGRRAHR